MAYLNPRNEDDVDVHDNDYWNQSQVRNHRFNFDENAAEFGENDLEFFGFDRKKAAELSHEMKTSLTLASLKQENNIEDIISNDGSVLSARYRKDPTSPDNTFGSGLQRPKLDVTKVEESASLPQNLQPKETAKRILFGNFYILEGYKSLRDKLALLDAALELQDGNTIIVAINHMKKTLKTSIFHRELKLRPVALTHYLQYMKTHMEWTALCDFLSMLGRFEEAALIKYKLALGFKQPDELINNLKHCHRNYFSPNTDDFRLVGEHISLLERQLPVEASDSKAEQEGLEMFVEIPRRASLFDTPVISTLFYCCLYHYNLSENNLASPIAIKKEFKLTDKQYAWAAISARARRQKFSDVEELLISKNWIGKTKMKAVINSEKILEILSMHGAPTNVLQIYIKLVEGSEQRLKLAIKYKCHHLVVDTLVYMKNRRQLKEYGEKLLSHSEEYLYVQNALRSPVVKWKN